MRFFRPFFLCFCLLVALAPAWAVEPGSPAIAAGNIDSAIVHFRELAHKNPADAESLHLLSRAYYVLGQWDEAIVSSLAALKLQANNSRYHDWLGRQYGEKADSVSFLSAAGYARKAKSEFERAVQLDPSSVPARRDLAEYCIEAPSIMGGGIDKAIVQADAVSRLDPASAHWIRARIAEKQSRFDEAEREFHAAIASAREPAHYWLNLASFYRAHGRPDDMQKATTTAAGLPDRHPAILFDAATVLLRGGRDFQGAIRYVRDYLAAGQFIEDAPEFQAHYVLGQLLEKSGQRAEAAAEYRASLALASTYGKAQAALRHLR